MLEIGAVGFSPDAPIVFKSGLRSPVYVDNRVLIYHPQTWRAVMAGFRVVIERYRLDFDLVAGVALGGVPHSSVLAYLQRKRAVFIRKAQKEHGTGQRIEGGAVRGLRALLVEDLVTTGGSSLSAVDALRGAGAEVRDVLAIVSYGLDEAGRAFDAADVALHTLTDFDAILDLARERGQIDDAVEALTRRWLADPWAWDGGAA